MTDRSKKHRCFSIACSSQIRRFKEKDAEKISDLIIRNLKEVNIKDYGEKSIEKSVKAFTPKLIKQRAKMFHMYVFKYNNEIVTTGSIAPFWGSETESIFLTIFVLPEYHNNGIGRKIIETLEKDELYIRAKRIEIPASITAVEFYRKFGYDYKNNKKELDNEKHYRLEKFK